MSQLDDALKNYMQSKFNLEKADQILDSLQKEYDIIFKEENNQGTFYPQGASKVYKAHNAIEKYKESITHDNSSIAKNGEVIMKYIRALKNNNISYKTSVPEQAQNDTFTFYVEDGIVKCK